MTFINAKNYIEIWRNRIQIWIFTSNFGNTTKFWIEISGIIREDYVRLFDLHEKSHQKS